MFKQGKSSIEEFAIAWRKSFPRVCTVKTARGSFPGISKTAGTGQRTSICRTSPRHHINNGNGPMLCARRSELEPRMRLFSVHPACRIHVPPRIPTCLLLRAEQPNTLSREARPLLMQEDCEKLGSDEVFSPPILTRIKPWYSVDLKKNKKVLTSITSICILLFLLIFALSEVTHMMSMLCCNSIPSEITIPSIPIISTAVPKEAL